jgi:hypothetical protein
MRLHRTAALRVFILGSTPSIGFLCGDGLKKGGKPISCPTGAERAEDKYINVD